MKKIILQVAFVAGLVLAMDVGAFMAVPSYRSIILWVASGTIEAIPVEFQKNRRIPSGVYYPFSPPKPHYMNVKELLECGFPNARNVHKAWGTPLGNAFGLRCEEGKWKALV